MLILRRSSATTLHVAFQKSHARFWRGYEPSCSFCLTDELEIGRYDVTFVRSVVIVTVWYITLSHRGVSTTSYLVVSTTLDNSDQFRQNISTLSFNKQVNRMRTYCSNGRNYIDDGEQKLIKISVSCWGTNLTPSQLQSSSRRLHQRRHEKLTSVHGPSTSWQKATTNCNRWKLSRFRHLQMRLH